MFFSQFAKLEQEFSIFHRCFIPSHITDAYLQPGYKYILFEENLHISGDLKFDWGMFETLGGVAPHEAHGLIIMGDLRIEGDLLNTDIDDGPLLLIRGNLVANNLYSGGSTIIVGRDASIRDIVFGSYNHGELIVRNSLYAGLVVMRSHGFSAYQTNASLIVDSETNLEPGEVEAVENMLRINARLETVIEEVDEIGAYLEQGTTILKAQSRNTKALEPTVFPSTAEEVISFARVKDRIFSGEIPWQLHQDRAFMLNLCSIHADIFNGLQNNWHLSPDFINAALDAGSLQAAKYIKFVDDPLIRQQLLNRVSGIG
jgi:hypothetical protein